MNRLPPVTPRCSRREALGQLGRTSLVGLLPWAGLQGCSRPPVKIGFLGGLTGPAADLGIAGRDSTLLAVEQFNGRGGLGGKPVDLVAFDDKQQPKALPALADSIRQAGLAGLVGPMTSSVAAAWIPLANELALTTVSPTVTSSDFTGLDDHFFRVCSTTREYAYASAEHHMRGGSTQRFALVRDDSNAAYTRSWAQHFSDRVAALGGQVVLQAVFTSGKQSEAVTDALTQALAYKPDALVMVANARDTALL
ncbi:MAG: ABC transporter substrate-binding protein, partial [Burkholderiales bacterium]|nr:ABC transporter substrate-binding protein [Burkholderiales bacterium]